MTEADPADGIQSVKIQTDAGNQIAVSLDTVKQTVALTAFSPCIATPEGADIGDRY